MSLGTATGTTPPPTRRESGLQEKGAAEPTTRRQALQKMAAFISLLPVTAGAVAVGAGGGLGFQAEARAANGATTAEVRETPTVVFPPHDDDQFTLTHPSNASPKLKGEPLCIRCFRCCA